MEIEEGRDETLSAVGWISTVVAALFAVLVIVIRLKASEKPTSAKKILIPPLGMSTGFLMFVVPTTHVALKYAAIAIAVGLLLSLPLIATSKFHVVNEEVYLKRSKGFILILVALLVLRVGLHQYIEAYVTLPQTAALFFILAFSMLSPWRVVMYLRFRELSNQIAVNTTHRRLAK